MKTAAALVLTIALFAPAAFAAPAAVLASADGQVLVNQGKQFVTASAGQALAAGDRVMLMKGARASLRFADGCVLPLSESSLVVVQTLSSCAGGDIQIASLQPMNAQAIGADALPSTTGLWAVFALPALGVLAGESGNDDDSVSP